MSDYDHETTAATDMLCEACALDGMWTRAERLAEAQVHATLAVAAALSWTPRYVMGINESRTYSMPQTIFTGSERADEVGA